MEAKVGVLVHLFDSDSILPVSSEITVVCVSAGFSRFGAVRNILSLPLNQCLNQRAICTEVMRVFKGFLAIFKQRRISVLQNRDAFVAPTSGRRVKVDPHVSHPFSLTGAGKGLEGEKLNLKKRKKFWRNVLNPGKTQICDGTRKLTGLDACLGLIKPGISTWSSATWTGN